MRLSLVPRKRRRPAGSTSGGARSAPSVRRVHSETPVARSRHRRVPSASPTKMRAPEETGGAVVSVPEGSLQRTRPVARSRAASAPTGHEDAVAVRDCGQGAAHLGLGFPPHGPGAGLQARDGSVFAADQDEAVGGAQAARQTVGLPRDGAGRPVERAHRAVARGDVDPAGVRGEGREDELAQQRLPGSREGEQGRFRGRPPAGATGDGERGQHGGEERGEASRHGGRTIHRSWARPGSGSGRGV